MKKILLFSLLVFLISSIPVFFGIINTPKEMYFIGGHVPNSGDFNFVLSQIRQGNILVKNLFTGEFQPRIFIPLSYIPLGIIGLFTKIPNLWLLQIGKLIYSFLFFWSAYVLIKSIWPDIKNIRFAMFVLAFSSGFGFFLKPFIANSTDLWIAEANTFHSILFSPNIIFNELLMILFLLLFFRKKNFLSGMVLMLLTFEHQFDAMVLLLAVFLYYLFEEKSVLSFIKKFTGLWQIWLFAVFSLLIQAFLIWYYPTVNAWSKQTYLNAPEFLAFFSGFGIIGIFTIIYLAKIKYSQLDSKLKLIFFWLLSSVLLIYGPIPFQRRFSEGLHVALVILAFVPLYNFYLFLKQKNRLLPIIFFAILFSTNIYLILLDINGYKSNFFNNQFYLYKTDVTALDWLQMQTGDKDLIMADAIYSPVIPYFTGRSVYFGHQVGTILTIDYKTKTENAKKFFFDNNDEFNQKLIKNNGITVLFIGKKDEDTGDYKIWDEKSYLRKIYEQNGVKIYRTK